jgi:RNA polymerase sigma-70 factor (ECF subfamily)
MKPSEQQAALQRARLGDLHARGQLLESFRPYIRFISRALHEGRLQARFDGSDLVQDALLEAHRHFADFRGDTVAALTAWLRKIVIRTATHTLRSHAGTARRDAAREVLVQTMDELAGSDSPPDDRAIRQEEAARLSAALDRLPEDMQQVLLGRHMDGLPYAALAERMGRSEAGLRVLYVRALERLREQWQE